MVVLLRGGFRGLLHHIFNGGQILRNTAPLDKLVQRLADLRDTYWADVEFTRLVKQADASPTQMAPTRMRSVLRAVLQPLLKDRSRKINTHDAFDLLHAVVAIAYCDFVFLDGAWRHQVERVRLTAMAHRAGPKE